MKARIGYRLALAVLVTMAFVSSTYACTQWSAAGVLKIRQSNGFVVSLSLFQEGENLTGRATYPGGLGRLDGYLAGPKFAFTVHWNNNAIGRYEGFVDANGWIIGGTTFDMSNPVSSATWSATKPLTCAVQ